MISRPHILIAAVFCTLAFWKGTAAEPITIDGPTVITEPGVYVLEQDFLDVEDDVFVDIEANDVTVDGQGHRIGGVGDAGSIGVRATVGAGTLDNVTIRNVTVEEWGTGIRLARVSNAVIEDNIVEAAILYGFRISNVNGWFEGNSALDGGSSGFQIHTVAESEFIGNLAAGNGRTGFSVHARDSLFEENEARENGSSGFWLSGTANVLKGNQAEKNGGTGFVLESISGCLLRDNAASGNDYNFSFRSTATGHWDNDIDESNLADGYPILYISDASDRIVSGPKEVGMIVVAESEGVVVEDVELVTPNGQGLLIAFSDDCTVSNVTVRNSNYGLDLRRSQATVRNVTMEDNRYNLSVTGSSIEHFQHDIDTSNLVNGRPVLYLRDLHDAEVDGSKDAGYIGIVESSNVSLNGATLNNNRQGLLIAASTEVQVNDLEVTGNWAGIEVFDSRGSLIENLQSSGNGQGIRLTRSHNNVIAGGELTDPTGIRLGDSNGNQIQNLELDSAEVGVLLMRSYRNRILDCVITHGGPDVDFFSGTGISFHRSSGNEIAGNHLTGGTSFELDQDSERNLLYNNYCEAIHRFIDSRFSDTRLTNTWNVSPRSGPNVVGGPLIAGNYWARPAGDGPSEVCGETVEGICPEPLVFGANNIDELPLADFEAIAISGPSTIDQPGYYVLEEDVSDEGGATVFIRIESDDVIVDGMGHRLDGNGDTAIVASSGDSGLSNISIRNFKLEGWETGIRLENVHGSEIWGNRIVSSGVGIAFGASTDNTVHANQLRENGVGIELDFDSDENLFYNNRFREERAVEGNSKENSWYVTPEAEQNIAGGPLLGGNFWGTMESDGISQVCSDVIDGFCSTAYSLPGGGLDAYPLVHSRAIVGSMSIEEPGYYYFEGDLSERDIWHFEETFLKIESSGVIVDGRGHSYEWSRFGPFLPFLRAAGGQDAELSDLTVQNLVVDAAMGGIVLEHVRNARIKNLELTRSRFLSDEWEVLTANECEGLIFNGNKIDAGRNDFQIDVSNSHEAIMEGNSYTVGNRSNIAFTRSKDSVFAENEGDSLQLLLDESDRSTVRNNNLDASFIRIGDSNGCLVEGNRIAAPWRRVHLSFLNASENIIRGNRFHNPAQAGLALVGSGSKDNLVYDNYFSRSNVTFSQGADEVENRWNIAPVPGRNIVGGPYIGGNFWAGDEGSGHSETCDGGVDGICVEPFEVVAGQFDRYPLAEPHEDDYAAWVQRHYGEEASESPELVAPEADPGNFGIPNILRYALALDPHFPDRFLLPVAGTSTQTGEGTENEEQYLTLTFSRKLDVTNIDFQIERSSDLRNWAPLEEMEVLLQQIEGSVEHVTIRDREPMDGDQQRFLRVKVEEEVEAIWAP